MAISIVRFGTPRAPGEGPRLALLATLSRNADFAVGCYCEDAAHCHRAVLRELLVEAGADVAGDASTAAGSTTAATASPPRTGTAPPRRRRAR